MVIHHDALKKTCGNEIVEYEDCRNEKGRMLREYMPQCLPKAKQVGYMQQD